MQYKNLKDILRSLRQEKLSPARKHAIKSTLDDLTSHSVRNIIDNRLHVREGRKLSIITVIHKRIMPIILAIAVLLGGSASVAAEGAVPGDFLYPVKVNVNEEVRSAFAVSDNAQAKWDAQVAERRLGEAAELAVSGKLTTEHKTRLETEFEEHAEKSETLLVDAEARGESEHALETRSSFQAALAAHERVLTRIAEERADTREHVEDILSRVRTRIATTSEGRMRVESHIRNESDLQFLRRAALGKQGAVRNTIEAVQTYIDRHQDDVSTDVAAEAQAQLSDAEEIFTEGEAELEAESYDAAFRLFTDAHAEAREAHVFMETSVAVEKEEQKHDDADQDEDDQEGDDADEQNEQTDKDDADDTEQRTLEIEADVFTDVTIVTVEQGDERSTFETDARTRAEIIADIAARYNLTEAEVASQFDFEIEDRAHRAGDSETDESDQTEGEEDDSGIRTRADGRIEIDL